MRFLFNQYDVDKTGVITRDNLVQLVKSGKHGEKQKGFEGYCHM